MSSRRSFLTGSLAATVLLARRAHSQPNLAGDPLRPQYHFLPPSGWMNDPNGPIVWNGKVHLFYQTNPHGDAKWDDISWGHAVSSDMVHWRHLPVVLTPTPGFADSYGVFSGSCIADGNRCLAFYTAVERSPNPAATTIHDPDKELREQQVVAVSTDPDLKVWTRQKQPLLSTPPLQPTAGFRDPAIWREGDTWYMVLGSGIRDKYGAALLFKATIPDGPNANWQYLHPLIDGLKNPQLPGTMWECPDFFPLDGRHVLLYSTDSKQHWATGRFDRTTLTFNLERQGLVDSGAYYAAKSMVGPHGERILWSWIPERRPEEQYVAAGWSGAMALPRVLRVHTDGSLRSTPIAAVDQPLEKPQTSNSEIRLPGLAAKLVAQLRSDGDTVTIQAGSSTLVDMRRITEDRLTVNGVELQTPLADGITAYIDGSVIELFFGDHAAHTVRAYPTLARDAGLAIVAEGNASIRAQAVRPISANRLTA